MENVLTQHIEATPGVLGGKPRIAGHRIRVMDIVAWHEKRGMSPDEIATMIYPQITVSDVHAALAYYFDHRDEIEAEFQREAAIVAEMRARYPSKLHARPC
ncbi:MAG: DUF433 domain-containing protein [Planctomycetes bacterium]|nr:DUF433 domain-containing protein [Planctomycetota bacterium]